MGNGNGGNNRHWGGDASNRTNGYQPNGSRSFGYNGGVSSSSFLGGVNRTSSSGLGSSSLVFDDFDDPDMLANLANMPIPTSKSLTSSSTSIPSGSSSLNSTSGFKQQQQQKYLQKQNRHQHNHQQQQQQKLQQRSFSSGKQYQPSQDTQLNQPSSGVNNLASSSLSSSQIAPRTYGNQKRSSSGILIENNNALKRTKASDATDSQASQIALTPSQSSSQNSHNVQAKLIEKNKEVAKLKLTLKQLQKQMAQKEDAIMEKLGAIQLLQEKITVLSTEVAEAKHNLRQTISSREGSHKSKLADLEKEIFALKSERQVHEEEMVELNRKNRQLQSALHDQSKATEELLRRRETLLASQTVTASTLPSNTIDDHVTHSGSMGGQSNSQGLLLNGSTASGNQVVRNLNPYFGVRGNSRSQSPQSVGGSIDLGSGNFSVPFQRSSSGNLSVVSFASSGGVSVSVRQASLRHNCRVQFLNLFRILTRDVERAFEDLSKPRMGRSVDQQLQAGWNGRNGSTTPISGGQGPNLGSDSSSLELQRRMSLQASVLDAEVLAHRAIAAVATDLELAYRNFMERSASPTVFLPVIHELLSHVQLVSPECVLNTMALLSVLVSGSVGCCESMLNTSKTVASAAAEGILREGSVIPMDPTDFRVLRGSQPGSGTNASSGSSGIAPFQEDVFDDVSGSFSRPKTQLGHRSNSSSTISSARSSSSRAKSSSSRKKGGAHVSASHTNSKSSADMDATASVAEATEPDRVLEKMRLQFHASGDGMGGRSDSFFARSFGRDAEESRTLGLRGPHKKDVSKDEDMFHDGVSSSNHDAERNFTVGPFGAGLGTGASVAPGTRGARAAPVFACPMLLDRLLELLCTEWLYSVDTELLRVALDVILVLARRAHSDHLMRFSRLTKPSSVETGQISPIFTLICMMPLSYEERTSSILILRELVHDVRLLEVLDEKHEQVSWRHNSRKMGKQESVSLTSMLIKFVHAQEVDSVASLTFQLEIVRLLSMVISIHPEKGVVYVLGTLSNEQQSRILIMLSVLLSPMIERLLRSKECREPNQSPFEAKELKRFVLLFVCVGRFS